MRIINLASGSKANSTLVEYGKTKILIDAGQSHKNLILSLKEVGASLDEIQAVLVTHEHSDHIKGLAQLAKKTNISVFVHEVLAKSGVLSKFEFHENQLRTFSSSSFEIGDLEILPFDISHDAIHPVGFRVNARGSKSKVSFLTDTGVANEKIKNVISGSKIIFLESNYDEDMLWNGFYPPEVKERIAGRYGHLSNDDSLELAKFLYKNGTRCFVLSHISQNNNTYDLAYENYKNYFESQKLVLDKDIFIRVSFQDKHGNNIILKEEF